MALLKSGLITINPLNRDQAVLSKVMEETNLLTAEIGLLTASTVVKKVILAETALNPDRKEKTPVLVIDVVRPVTSSVIALSLIIDLSVEVMITETGVLATEMMIVVTSNAEIEMITNRDNPEVLSLVTIVENRATRAVTAPNQGKKGTCLKYCAITVNKLDIWLVTVPMNASNVSNASTGQDNKVGTDSVIIIDSLKDNNAHLLVTTAGKMAICHATVLSLANPENIQNVERVETETEDNREGLQEDHTALMMKIDN